jgi:hypothetical protein
VIAQLAALALAANPSLKAADLAAADLAFDVAQGLYQKALEEPGSREERIRAWKGLGLAQAIQGESAGARAAFEKMLMLDAKAEVDTSMGPKIAKPFEDAKDAVAGKRNEVIIERSAEGPVTARLAEDLPMAAAVVLYARPRGVAKFRIAKADDQAQLRFPPETAVEAYAEAIDVHDGILYADSSRASPRTLPATKATSAVAAAVDEAKRESRREGTAPASAGLDDDEESSSWPVYVGIGAVVVAGVAAGVLLAQPQKLALPTADRTSHLPFVQR